MQSIKESYWSQTSLLSALMHICPDNIEAVARFNMLTARCSADHPSVDFYNLTEFLEKMDMERLKANQSCRDRGRNYTTASWEVIFVLDDRPLFQLISSDEGGIELVRKVFHRLSMFHKMTDIYQAKFREHAVPISQENIDMYMKKKGALEKNLESKAQAYLNDPEWIHPIRPQGSPEFKKIVVEIHLEYVELPPRLFI